MRRRAFDAPGKLELSAFLCWKHAALHNALNRWIGTRFGDVAAFQVLCGQRCGYIIVVYIYSGTEAERRCRMPLKRERHVPKA